jgi:hypothetical protein
MKYYVQVIREAPETLDPEVSLEGGFWTGCRVAEMVPLRTTLAAMPGMTEKEVSFQMVGHRVKIARELLIRCLENDGKHLSPLVHRLLQGAIEACMDADTQHLKENI